MACEPFSGTLVPYSCNHSQLAPSLHCLLWWETQSCLPSEFLGALAISGGAPGAAMSFPAALPTWLAVVTDFSLCPSYFCPWLLPGRNVMGVLTFFAWFTLALSINIARRARVTTARGSRSSTTTTTLAATRLFVLVGAHDHRQYQLAARNCTVNLGLPCRARGSE